MKDAKKSRKVKDIKVKTQVDPESIGRIDPTGPDQPASCIEVEETTILINPDADSMESRG